MGGRDEHDEADAGFGESSRYAAHLDRGWALLDKGELSAARTSVQHAQDVRPDDPDAALLLGAIALAEGNANEALRCYDRAIELDADYLEPYAAAAAVCLYDLDDPSRGLRYAGEAIDLEDLAPFELLDLQLIAAECELAGEDLAGARERLTAIGEGPVLDAALELASSGAELAETEDDEAKSAAWEFLALDAEGELLEDEERIDRGQRVVGFALRLCQLRLDAELLEPALVLLRRLAQWFSREPEVFALLAEAEFRAGAVAESSRAGVRTLELDAEIPLPEWVPSPAVLHRRVVGVLAHCGEPRLAALVDREPTPTIHVRDLPPPELVLEGVSPRVAVLALASRGPEAASSSRSSPELGALEITTLTGLAIYRKNLARFARDADALDAELRFGVLEELAQFFGFSAKARRALGLDDDGPPRPSPVAPDSRADASDEHARIDTKPRRRAAPRKRKGD
jgi:tetratricopeptide (TPR) repeat protein